MITSLEGKTFEACNFNLKSRSAAGGSAPKGLGDAQNLYVKEEFA